MNIYDNVTFKTENGDKSGKVLKLTETTVKSATADMSGVSEEVTTKVTLLVMPDMRVVSVMSDEIVTTPTKKAESTKK